MAPASDILVDGGLQRVDELGDALSLGDGGGLIWNFNGIDGICRNIPAHIPEGMSDYTFDVTTSGDRTTSVTIHHLSDDPNANPRMRITAESTSEFEYEN